MNKILFITLMISLPFSLQAESTTKTATYKCMVGGKVKYTNQTPGPNEKCSETFTHKRPAAPVTTGVVTEEANVAASNGDDKASAGKKGQKEKMSTDKVSEDQMKKILAEEAARKEEEKKAREQNCKMAKLNVGTLELGRVSRVNEKGEKYFLDSATIAGELEQAKKDVREWCGE